MTADEPLARPSAEHLLREDLSMFQLEINGEEIPVECEHGATDPELQSELKECLSMRDPSSLDDAKEQLKRQHQLLVKMQAVLFHSETSSQESFAFGTK